MISRRLLRIKALLVLYAFNRKEGDDLNEAEKELNAGINKAYDLYLYLLLLLVELAAIANEKIEAALQKKMPTRDDLHPRRRFADSIIIVKLAECSMIEKIAREKGVSWSNSREISRVLYNKMVSWEPYKTYIKGENSGINEERKFLMTLLTELLLTSDDLISHLEEQSIFWNDDLEFAVIMVEKTLRKIKDDGSELKSLLPLYKNEDDEKFATLLLRKALLSNSTTRELIDKHTTNWEIERIALMDILVMQLALAEIIAFPEIPVKVTLNEYIEIAKYYSTSKSSTFINGILDKVVREMREKNMFEKSGRGLIGETEIKD
jgi:transcription antitermination protein NusB